MPEAGKKHLRVQEEERSKQDERERER